MFLITINYLLLDLSKEFDNENRETSDELQELSIDIFDRQYDLLEVNQIFVKIARRIYI